MRSTPRALEHPLLASCGVRHGFGVRGVPEPDGLRRPRQVHGIRVLRLAGEPPGVMGEGDGLVSCQPGVPVGVVTADCVPLLLAAHDGRCVAAVHAGWRGLAAGVVAAAAEVFGGLASTESAVAVIGPHVGPCCYEVDGVVVRAFEERFAGELEGALVPVRHGHWRLDLASLARAALGRAGWSRDRIAVLADACTACAPDRFHSYRRDGPRAGRLVHFVAAREKA